VILYPAVDILGGNAVRLERGDFDARKVYDEDPLEAARCWVQAGARHLHVVDLDGAKTGRPVNLEHLRRIAEHLRQVAERSGGDTQLQYGGGLRSTAAIRDALQAGADRVILGTAAFTDAELLQQAMRTWPGRVLVAVDVRGGRLTTAGWTETTTTTAAELFEALRRRGVSELVYTNVDRDGMLAGPDLEEVRRVARTVHGGFIYSGGIGQLADLERLAGLDEPSLTGVIVGKALYERRFTIAEAQAALDGQ
jgi:phosphoribosylformimino-5-aminoimidazole carboxamide ribotide isomerase